MMKPVNLVIFSSRESSAELVKTLHAAIAAAPDNSVIDILINGNIALSRGIASVLSTDDFQPCQTIRVWHIPAADKANAWNQHIHSISDKDLDCVYIDGYVQPKPDAITKLQETLASHPGALGSSGAPSTGWSAKAITATMQSDGGFHGNLCAITANALAQIRKTGIRLPLGMYRVDALMGAFLSFGLANTNRTWSPKEHVPVTFDATWHCRSKKWYSLQDINAWLSRRERQIRGKVENAAIKQLLVHEGIRLEDIPRDVAQLSREWVKSKQFSQHDKKFKPAIHYLTSYSPPHPDDLKPLKIYDSSTTHWPHSLTFKNEH